MAVTPVDLTYSFVLTNRHGQDILLIALDNKDARIGVLGKWFILTGNGKSPRKLACRRMDGNG